MKNRKITAAALALLMLAAGMASCSQSSEKTADTSAPSLSQDSEKPAEDSTETEVTTAALPVIDYEGREFRIAQDGWDIYNVFYDSALTGEIIDDAAYYRNLAVAEKYDITLTYDVTVHSNDVLTNWAQSVLAGDGAWDLMSGASPYIAIPMAKGIFTDLSSLEYIDLSQDCWWSGINDAAEIVGKLYIGTGYFDMPTLTRAEVVFFNSDFVTSYNLGNLYQLVNDNEWTFDKLIELSQKTASDLDGNGVMDNTDQYGLTSQWDLVADSYISTGYSYINRLDDGSVVLSGYDDRFVEMGKKIYNLLYNSSDWYYSGYTYLGDEPPIKDLDDMYATFAEGRSLFFINMLECAQRTDMRDMGTYGILPTPKYTTEQESYGSVVAPFSSAIPADSSDIECSSIIFQALTAESYENLLPAYYDIALSGKYLNDEESIKMLDLISGNTRSDFIYIYGEAAAIDVPMCYAFGIYDNYTSWYAQNEARVNGFLADFVDTVKNFAN